MNPIVFVRQRLAHVHSVTSRSFPPNLARLMLLGCAILWGASYLAAKLVITTVGPNWMMACRTLIAAAVMLLLFYRVIIPHIHARVIIPALVVGLTYFGTLEMQMQGLVTVDPGRSAFLSAGYCVVMPFAAWIIVRKPPQFRALVAAIICMAGVGFVSIKAGFTGFAFSVGDWLSVASAVAYAFNVMFHSVWGRRFHPIAMTFWQFIVSGIGFVICALCTERMPDAQWLSPTVIGGLAFLILGSTMLGQIFQNIGVAHLPAAQASIIMSLESVCSVVFSALWYGERITVSSEIGFALIFLAILISQVRPRHIALRFHRPRWTRLHGDGGAAAPAVASVKPTVPTPAVPLG